MFMKTCEFINKVENNIGNERLINPGDKILVGFSGGPDSTALMHVLYRLSLKLKFSLIACYINHKIRPRAAKKEIEFCRNICKKLKIEFVLYDIDIPKYSRENKLSLEEAGFIQRKKILRRITEENRCNKIALGHHRDDIIETILFRLFRGTGPGGLQPMKPISENILRPLYNISKEEILGYLKRNRISYLIDKSNMKSNFSRNYIRNKIIPTIKQHFGDGYRNSIGHFAEIISAENDYLSALADKKLKKIVQITPGGKIVVDLPGISVYDDWLRRRIIKQLLERLSGLPGAGSFEDIARINSILEGELKAVNLKGEGGMRVIREGDNIFFTRGRIDIRNVEMEINGRTKIAELNSHLKSSLLPVGRARTVLQKDGNKVNIDYDKIAQPCCIRGIRPGDRFAPLGMKGTKKVGDFLTDKKVSKYLRDEIPVLLDQKGPIWLMGYQISDRVKVDKFTKRVLDIEYFKRKRNQA